MDGTQGNEQQPELTPEQIAADAAADADFEAAFNSARSDELGTEVTTTNSTTPAAPAAAAQANPGNPDDFDPEAAGDGTGAPAADGTPPAAAATPDDDDAPVTLTRRQLAELTSAGASVAALKDELRQLGEKTNGRFGSFQQTLKEVRELATTGQRPSFDQLEAMEAEFPELAAVLKKDLAKVWGKGNEVDPAKGAAGTDEGNASGADAPGAAPTVDPLEHPEVRKVLRAAQLTIVDSRHEGWRALPATPEWKAWSEQLPPAAQELLRTTGDAETLSDAITGFKEWQTEQAKKASASTERNNRLANAIPATTGSSAARPPAPNDDDEFEKGFAAVARR